MFTVEVTLPLQTLDGIDHDLETVVARMNALAARYLTPVGARMVDVLSTPPPPASNYYPLRWKSERQRRAFFATNGFGGGIPHIRTGALEAAWFSTLEFYADGGALTIANPAEAARYVQGDDVQPMFMQIPWRQLDIVARAGFDEAERATDLSWTIATGAV